MTATLQLGLDACGCERRVFITDRSQVVDFTKTVDRTCPCCGALRRKRCTGAGAGKVEETDKHPAFTWADVCPDRIVSA